MRWLFYKRRPVSITDAADRFRRELLAGEAKTARRIRSAYRDAHRAIAKDLEALVKKIEAANAAGHPIRTSWLLQRARIEQLLGRIQGQIDQYTASAAGATVAGQTSATTKGATHAKGLAKSAGITSGFRQLNPSAFADLIGTLEPGSPLYDLFRDVSVRAVSHARTVFAKAMAEGANPRETAKQLARQIQGLTENRALLIARTETMRSYRSSQIRTYRANADVITGWRWQAAKNSRTCPMCLAMDGTLHPLDTVMATHPACRCMQVPITEYTETPKETGAEWLAKQSDDVQRKILGRTKAELFQKGELQLSDLVAETAHPRWGKGRREASLAMAIANAARRNAASSIRPLSLLSSGSPQLPGVPWPATVTPSAHAGAATACLRLPTAGNEAFLDQLRASADAIDGVHGFGSAPLSRYVIPVRVEKMKGGEAEFVPIKTGPRAGTPLRIAINEKTTDPEYALAHEFGHFIDWVGMSGKPIHYGMSGHVPTLTGNIQTLWEEFFDVVAQTDQIQAYLQGRHTGGMPWRGNLYDVRSVRAQEAIEYHLYPWEIWARAYAQFIGRRSASAGIKRTIDGLITSGGLMEEHSQWDERSFDLIEPKIEAILKELGMMP